ncbi:MAG TPA: kelch repeat-containing protein [Blastocatellia bacterium]|nr:kelch repeat-containing protein [Blastocatellia bacterium]
MRHSRMNLRSHSPFSITLLICTLAGFMQVKAQQPAWSATGSLGAPRSQHTATLLANGKVLVVGGISEIAPCCAFAGAAELYDPATGQWSEAGSPITIRVGHAALRLANGKVLIVGGAGAINAEIYDPDSGAWTNAGNPGASFVFPRAELLTDGRALVTGGFVGGSGLRIAKIYDPTTNAWNSAGAMNAERLLHSITLLPDGRALIAGGFIDQPLRTAEIYDPATNRWTFTGDLIFPRADHQAVLLANNKALIAGGVGPIEDDYKSAQLYDPATGRWSATGAPTTLRFHHTLTLLPNGKALVIGGSLDNSAELYDPATGRWTLTAASGVARQNHTATLLLNGKVLFTGGETLSIAPPPIRIHSSAELFDSGAPSVANVSAASFAAGPLAPESISAAFGANLAANTQTASGIHLPTELAGVSVRIRDSLSAERLAPLFFVSPGQLNYQIPSGTAGGQAIVTVMRGGSIFAAGSAVIGPVAPGLFSANADGQSVAAAVVLRIKADGAQSFEPVAQFDAGLNRFVAAPIDLGPASDQVFLALFGSGIRFRSALSAVRASIGGTNSEVLFADAAPGFIGLDQINVRLPRSLEGRGAIDVELSVDGRASNKVRVSVR